MVISLKMMTKYKACSLIEHSQAFPYNLFTLFKLLYKQNLCQNDSALIHQSKD